MWKSLSPLMEFADQYHGFIIGLVGIAGILLLNQLIYRHWWKSYPTLEEYLAAHPNCDTASGIVCSTCRRLASGGPIIGKGRMYWCTRCETELYRVDQTGPTLESWDRP